MISSFVSASPKAPIAVPGTPLVMLATSCESLPPRLNLPQMRHGARAPLPPLPWQKPPHFSPNFALPIAIAASSVGSAISMVTSAPSSAARNEADKPPSPRPTITSTAMPDANFETPFMCCLR